MPKNLTPEQFRSTMWGNRHDPKPAKDAAEKLDKQKFWAMWVPLGAVIALVLSLWAGSAGAFFFAWPVVYLFLWGMFGRKGLPE
jgi:hypothetical protein